MKHKTRARSLEARSLSSILVRRVVHDEVPLIVLAKAEDIDGAKVPQRSGCLKPMRQQPVERQVDKTETKVDTHGRENAKAG